jgi:hypothetical protein
MSREFILLSLSCSMVNSNFGLMLLNSCRVRFISLSLSVYINKYIIRVSEITYYIMFWKNIIDVIAFYEL